jgi:hypothetical protein
VEGLENPFKEGELFLATHSFFLSWVDDPTNEICIESKHVRKKNRVVSYLRRAVEI